MQQQFYQTLQEMLHTLKAVTAELHLRHGEGAPPEAAKACRHESCRAMGRLEAQVDSLRRSLGLSRRF